MVKRKITVTVEAATLEQAQALGVQNLSAVVEEAPSDNPVCLQLSLSVTVRL